MIWKPIAEAPPAPAKFWARRVDMNDDTIMIVQRATGKEYQSRENPDAIAVINYRIGKFWWPTHFIALEDIPLSPDGDA